MEVVVTHGPDGSVVRTDGGRVLTAHGRPFHGVAPRGLLPWLGVGDRGPRYWQRVAPLVDDLIHFSRDPGPDDGLREAVRAAGVLPFSASAGVASEVALDHVRQRWPRATGVQVAGTKEGHTSSVWEVSVRTGPGARVARFVLNVARDTDLASRELSASSARLRRLTRQGSVRVAGVEAVVRVEVPGDRRRRVTVTRNEWVRDAQEIHRLPDGAYAMVQQFLTDPQDPARVVSVLGRRATRTESAAVDAVLEAHPSALDVNDGDVVWDGNRPVVVAVG